MMYMQRSLFFPHCRLSLAIQPSCAQKKASWNTLKVLHGVADYTPAGAPHPPCPTALTLHSLTTSHPPHMPTSASAGDALMQPQFIVMETRSLFLSKASLMAWRKISVPHGRSGIRQSSFPCVPLHVQVMLGIPSQQLPNPSHAHHAPSAVECAPGYRHNPNS